MIDQLGKGGTGICDMHEIADLFAGTHFGSFTFQKRTRDRWDEARRGLLRAAQQEQASPGNGCALGVQFKAMLGEFQFFLTIKRVGFTCCVFGQFLTRRYTLPVIFGTASGKHGTLAALVMETIQKINAGNTPIGVVGSIPEMTVFGLPGQMN